MENSLTFLYVVYFISVAIHAFTLFFALAFVIPLQVREARVRNGLVKLRKLMLTGGIIIISLSMISILALTSRYYLDGVIVRYVTVALILLHSLGFLSFTLIQRAIYKSQYSERQKDLHEKIAKLETVENKAEKEASKK